MDNLYLIIQFLSPDETSSPSKISAYSLSIEIHFVYSEDLVKIVFSNFSVDILSPCCIFDRMELDFKMPKNAISFRAAYLTGEGVGARTCLTGEGECLMGDGDCCRASCALAAMDGGVGDLDLGFGGILGGVLCGSCWPVAPSMTISTVAIDLASKWASIFCKK